LISDSASARCEGTADSTSIAAAARPSKRAEQRTRPRPESEILIMVKPPSGGEGLRRYSGRLRAFILDRPAINLEMTT
jgi:hypothetical protein